MVRQRVVRTVATTPFHISCNVVTFVGARPRSPQVTELLARQGTGILDRYALNTACRSARPPRGRGCGQPSTIGPGNIRCPDCAQSGQKPATAAFDASQIEFVANPVPVFYENQTIRFSVIARVLQPALLILDVLDSRIQTVDRNMRVVATGSRAANDSSDCLFMDPHQPVDFASKTVVSALQLNDIVTADVILNRNSRIPNAILGGTPTVINVRKAAAPVPFFHAGQVKPECANRSATSSSIWVPKTASSRSCTTTASSITATART